ncbi:MAG: 50S ribosome-binding GTPase [Clostridiales bacterium]|nr:50S ribosome-binding GTPase [Clostridiales bacterium]
MSRISSRQITDQVIKKLNNEYNKLDKLNIMVLGKTGVGKSTLINSIFGEKMVLAGTGKPVTNDISKVEQDGFPLVLYDTPGLELTGNNDYSSLSKQITKLIKDNYTDKIVGNEIHCIIYCVNTVSRRFESAESSFLRDILGKITIYNVPVIMVLTQAFSKNDAEALTNVIREENLPITDIIPVLADEYEFDEDITIPPYGVDTLTDKMAEILPESVRNTFIALESASLTLKLKIAKSAVNTASLAAAVTAAIPVPLADTAVLIPDQIAMLTGITLAFGFKLNKETTDSLITGTMNAIGPTVLGKQMRFSLLKFIPGVGHVISGTTAATIMESLGLTYIKLITMVYTGEIKMQEVNTPEGKKMIQRMFKGEMITAPAADKEENNG